MSLSGGAVPISTSTTRHSVIDPTADASCPRAVQARASRDPASILSVKPLYTEQHTATRRTHRPAETVDAARNVHPAAAGATRGRSVAGPIGPARRRGATVVRPERVVVRVRVGDHVLGRVV